MLKVENSNADKAVSETPNGALVPVSSTPKDSANGAQAGAGTNSGRGKRGAGRGARNGQGNRGGQGNNRAGQNGGRFQRNGNNNPSAAGQNPVEKKWEENSHGNGVTPHKTSEVSFNKDFLY